MKTRAVLFAVGMLIAFTPFAIADDNEVTVTHTYMTDGSGHNYGMNFYLNSNHGVPVCVNSWVESSSNVGGQVTSGTIRLPPGQQNVYIGQFTQSDMSQAWNVSVRERWVEC